MGTDIDGGVEIRPGGPGTQWRLTDVDLGELPRHYDAYGLLFGVRNYAGFDPVAPSRGLPQDASDGVLAMQTPSPTHDHTWVTSAELSAIDWTAVSPRLDDRIHEYRVTEGEPVFVGKASHHGVAWRAVAGERADPQGSHYPEDTQWRSGDRLWRVGRVTRAEVLTGDPALRDLLDAMRALGDQYGADNVRLVVWFDS